MLNMIIARIADKPLIGVILMATCKDCIHNVICSADAYFKIIDDADRYCCHFRDKSRYIELPCKVGDTVYEPIVFCDYGGNPFSKCYVGGSCNDCAHHIAKVLECKFTLSYYDQIKNKEIFTIREEAEKALKEKCRNESHT